MTDGNRIGYVTVEIAGEHLFKRVADENIYRTLDDAYDVIVQLRYETRERGGRERYGVAVLKDAG